MENIKDMQINFRIPVFMRENNILVKSHDRVFNINFIPGSSAKKFRIVINGKLTNSVINAFDTERSKKPKFLEAIQEYIEANIEKMSTPNERKYLTEQKMRQLYANIIVNAFKHNVLACETEQNRDVLSQYNLIFTI